MKCYIINLDRSADRLEFMIRQFRYLQEKVGVGIQPIRIPAVDAKQLPKETIDRYYDRYFFSFNATYFPNVVPPGGLSNGEVACFLSHRKCWETIVSGEEDYAAVFEDDVIFSSESGDFLKDATWIPQDADIVKLEVLTKKLIVSEKPEKQVYGRDVSRFFITNIGAAAYIISKKAAKRLLNMTERFYVPVDHVMFGNLFPYFDELVSYQVIPALCVQEREIAGDDSQFGSTVEGAGQAYSRTLRKKIPLLAKIKREIIRFKLQLKARKGAKKKILNSFNKNEAFALWNQK